MGRTRRISEGRKSEFPQPTWKQIPDPELTTRLPHQVLRRINGATQVPLTLRQMGICASNLYDTRCHWTTSGPQSQAPTTYYAHRSIGKTPRSFGIIQPTITPRASGNMVSTQAASCGYQTLHDQQIKDAGIACRIITNHGPVKN